MPRLHKSGFKYNAKIFEKTCQWCGTIYYASRSTAKYCSSTCRGYAHQALKIDDAAPWTETERTVDSLLSEIAWLKGQISQYANENAELRKQIDDLKSR